MAKDITKEFILCAAVRYDKIVICGRRHNDCYSILQSLRPDITDADLPGREHQGFMTSKDRYVTREQGYLIAKEQGQILHYHPSDDEIGTLISEDLY